MAYDPKDDFYVRLGIPRDATSAQIRKARKRLVHKVHPDKAGGSTLAMQQVNEACEVLSDPDRRRQYDAERVQYEKAAAARARRRKSRQRPVTDRNSQKNGAERRSEAKAHSAEAAALGFYYQTFFALLTLLKADADDAAVGVEQLDDVVLSADGNVLLFQLKYAMREAPPPVTLKSRAFWRTVKVWIDVLPTLSLAETTLHLVTVADIASSDVLRALTSPEADREDLVDAMVEEAQTVMDARVAASEANEPLPYEDRVDGCEAFLGLAAPEQLNLLRRAIIIPSSPTIGKIEELVAKELKLVPRDQRNAIAERLVEWWDRQVIYSLCGRRNRVISRAELQEKITHLIGDLEQGRLIPSFETVSPPQDYQPDSMLAQQIRLVKGRESDLSKAIREEWKAREQRSKWLNEKPSMAAVIDDYDRLLREHWSDRHTRIVEECATVSDEAKRASGLNVLRWTHEEAPRDVRPIAEGWNAAYYIRGSYQVLAINLKVGWHPDYEALLGDAE